MAKQVVVAEKKPGWFGKIKLFLEEVQVEMKKVTWPTVEDLKVSTKVTMYMLLAMAALIFVYDQVFQRLVLFLLNIPGFFE
jgi:preprotein translocase subunit SecE